MPTVDRRRRPPAQTCGLEALLTPLRARLLNDLNTPKTMSEIAAEMFLAPSSATYQVGVLAGSGLVDRTRTGTTVRVRRTPLGDRLLGLYRRSATALPAS